MHFLREECPGCRGEVELFWRLSPVASLGTENKHRSTQIVKQAIVFCMTLMSTLPAGPADSYAVREGGRKETIWRAPKAAPRVVARNSWYSSPNKRPQERNGRRPLRNEGQTGGGPPGLDTGKATHKLLSSLCHH